jgi:cytochrome c oxidase subunit 1
MFFANMLIALFKESRAEDNPWGGVTLEWRISSPPPKDNFEEIPVIRERPYVFNREASE